MKSFKDLLLYIALVIIPLFISNSLVAQQLAFPTAMGAGAYTTGGRGGIVVHVTNLNNSGTGSFRSAMEDFANQDRTIVFDVSGVIQLNSEIVLSAPSQGGNASGAITIAGQSAPQGGIIITGGRIRLFGIDDIIVRYIKFRSTTDVEGAFVSIDGDGIIVSNCSFSHIESAEMALSIVDNSENPSGKKKTIQNNLIYQSGLGTIIGDTTPFNDNRAADYSLIRNVYVNVGHRIPAKTGGAIGVDMINNLCHNWDNRLIRTDDWSFELNHINNYYSGGQNSDQLKHAAWQNNGSRGRIYNSGNYMDAAEANTGFPADPNINWSEFQNNYTTLAPQTFVNTQFPLKGNTNYSIYSSNELKTEVLPYVGAYKYINDNGIVIEERDSFDLEAIQKMIDEPENDGRNTVLEVNDIPAQNNTRPSNFYVSNPHIPEVYFMVNGITGNATIHNQVQPSGYTLLEEYLNQVDNYEVIALQSIAINPNEAGIEIAEVIDLQVSFLPVDATNRSGVWSSSDESIAQVDGNGSVTGIAPGTAIITFTSFYDETIQAIATITVFEEALSASAGEDIGVCEGESAVLTASGGTSYLWSTGETTAQITVNPLTTTTYSVLVSNDIGEEDTDEVTVTVNAFPIADAGEDQTICQGDTITLTANGGDAYLWSNGQTTQSIEVSPIADTTYTVEVSTNNCVSSDSVVISVLESPNLTATENSTIVQGDSITLTADGSNNYQWSTGETATSITVSPNQTTTYTVSSSNPNGCSTTLDITVSVELPFQAEAGEDQSVCQDDNTGNVTLTANTGDAYLWNTGETTQSISVNPNATSTYTVTITSGIQQDVDDVTVIVNPNPDVVIQNGSSVDIMNGDFVTLSASGANTYLWNNGATQPNIAVSPNQTTTYEVEGYIGDCADQKQVVVNVIPEVIAEAGDDVEICLGDTITLTASGGDDYEWSTGENTQSIQVSPTETTEYTVTVFNPLDFDEDSVVVTVDTDCEEEVVPIISDEPLDFSFDIFPNPASDYVDVRLSGSVRLTRVYLYDITGKLIHYKRMNNESLNVASTTRIDVSSLKPGMYYITMVDLNRAVNKKLLIR
jgi:hypothetical protein